MAGKEGQCVYGMRQADYEKSLWFDKNFSFPQFYLFIYYCQRMGACDKLWIRALKLDRASNYGLSEKIISEDSAEKGEKN